MSYPIDETLALRLLTPDDIDEYWALVDAQREWMTPWLRWAATATRESCLAILERNVAAAEAGEGWSRMGIFDTSGATPQLIGRVGQNEFNRRHDWCSIAYWIAQERAGAGIVTRAVSKLIDISFDEFAMHRIEIRCQPENQPSMRIPERLGFTKEGVMRGAFKNQFGEYCDEVIYSLLSDEWLPQS